MVAEIAEDYGAKRLNQSTRPSQFTAVYGGPLRGTDTSRHPVENVSREECQQFLDRLNARVAATSAFPLTGRFVIPTEYEWEYACRGGLGNRQPFYFGDRFDGTQANGDGHRPYKGAAGPCLGHTTPVGKYEAVAPHPWGLCDMHGNVWEFCDQIGPAAPRVIRGGCYFSSCGECRSAARNFPAPETVRYMNLGFRVCFRPERPKR